MSEDALPEIFSLPLFPLKLVLFPQLMLQLHIFEERYKAMISNCLERNQPFGVVLIRNGEEVGAPAVPHEVGCVARIVAVKHLEDGRMNLLIAGERRFRILEYGEADLPYLVGTVEAIEDAPLSEETLQNLQPDLKAQFERYVSLLSECAQLAIPSLELPEDPTLLTFCIACIAQMSLEEKQHLLAMTDTADRMRLERRYLRRQIEELEAMLTRQRLENEIIDDDEIEMEDTPPSSGQRVIIALPLDLKEPEWKRFLHESRN